MDRDPFKTQHEVGSSVVSELSAAGFEDAEEIGRGGFAIVYRCKQVALDRVVAVKALTAELDENRERFVREQHAMARLTGHPNIVGVLHVGETPGGVLYLVMQYHRRGSLEARIKRVGLLTLGEVLRVGVKIAGALETAHRLKILHRDVKPSNILLTDYGEPALSDFGIARMSGAFKTFTGTFTGSPAFTAPEILSGDPPTEASDVYELGATLFSALTGHAAFERRSGEQVVTQFLRIATEPAPDLREAGIPHDVAAVVEAAMVRDPKDRPALRTWGEQLQQLQSRHGFPVDKMALHGEPDTEQAALRPMVSAGERRSPGNLQPELTSFVGRRREIAAIKQSIPASRLVTLTGIGGVGKTRLARRVAHDLRRSFPDGTSMIELGDVREPDTLINFVAHALGVPNVATRDLQATLVQYLRDRHQLVVLDNCEHLRDACGQLVNEILCGTAHVRILATSREPLGVTGEHTYPVPPLSIPDTANVAATVGGDVYRFEAVELFEERAAAVIPGFHLDARSKAVAAELCQRLDGLPLAIELAAVRLRALSIEEIVARLEDRYRLLKSGSRGGSPRHQTLRAAIDWSYDLCDAREKAMWARVSVFTGGFDLEAAEAVCPDESIPREDVLDVLASLIDKSIVTREDDGSHARYRFLETIREYGREKLVETGLEAEFRRRHRDHYLRLAEESETSWFGTDQVAWSERLQSNQANLTGALDYCLTSGEFREGLRMAAALCFFWNACGHLRDGRYWLGRALNADGTPSAERAKALWVNGWDAITQGDDENAKRYFDECMELADLLNDETARAFAIQFRGAGVAFTGDLPKAKQLLEEAVAYHRRSDTLSSLSVIGLTQLAFVCCLTGDVDRAITLCEEALEVCEQHQERWTLSWTLWVLGLTRWARQEFTEASESLERALTVKWSLNDWLGVSHCVQLLAWIAVESGELERAATLFGASPSIWEAIGAQLFGMAKLIQIHNDYTESARKALGQKPFERQYHKGSQLTVPEIVTFALRQKAQADSPPSTVPQPKLTRREREVCELIAAGLSNKEIAEKLVIAQRTAEGHVENVLVKLGFNSRAQVAAWLAKQQNPHARSAVPTDDSNTKS
jgi:non-specific serine/threonine protein kinase